MRSESARRILSKTPQDVKDKVIAYADEVARKSKHTNTMTKIEQLEKEAYSVSGDGLYTFTPEELEAYKSAIREQVVIDALPSEKIKTLSMGDKKAEWAMTLARTAMIESLTTREEVERPYVELLKEIKADVTLPVSIWNKLTSLTDGK
jgi:hypothetical protein